MEYYTTRISIPCYTIVQYILHENSTVIRHEIEYCTLYSALILQDPVYRVLSSISPSSNFLDETLAVRYCLIPSGNWFSGRDEVRASPRQHPRQAVRELPRRPLRGRRQRGGGRGPDPPPGQEDGVPDHARAAAHGAGDTRQVGRTFHYGSVESLEPLTHSFLTAKQLFPGFFYIFLCYF